jgi:hypothetical protein
VSLANNALRVATSAPKPSSISLANRCGAAKHTQATVGQNVFHLIEPIEISGCVEANSKLTFMLDTSSLAAVECYQKNLF